MAQPSPPAVHVPQPPHTGPPSCGQSYCPIAQALLVMLSRIPSPTGLRLAAMAKRHIHCGKRTVAQCGATWHSCPLPRARWSRSPWKGMWVQHRWFFQSPSSIGGKRAQLKFWSLALLLPLVCTVGGRSLCPEGVSLELEWCPLGSFPPLWALLTHKQLCPRSPQSTRHLRPLVPSPMT